MGLLQSRVIGEVVAPVALLSGIAPSPENTVRYRRHRRKTVISLRWSSLVLLIIGSTPPSSSYRSRPVAQLQPNTLLCGIAPPRPPLDPCSLLIGWFSLLWPCAQWLGLAVGVSDLPPLPLTGHAPLLVRFRWVHGLSFRSPHTYQVLAWLRISRWGLRLALRPVYIALPPTELECGVEL